MEPITIAYYTGLAAAIMSLLLSGSQTWEHLTCVYENQKLRRYVLRIFWMVPIYAFESWCGLFFSDWRMYWETLRDLYEALVIFSFYQLLIEYLGGPYNLRHKLRLTNADYKHKRPFCCLPQWAPAWKFIIRTKCGTLQYVFIKIFCAIASFVSQLTGHYHEGRFSASSVYFWVTTVSNLSQVWAMYCLILFYLATKHWLEDIRPVSKFLCVKSVVFFTFWQSFLLSLLQYYDVISDSDKFSSDAITAGLSNYLIIFEMVFAAFAHRYAFPISDFDCEENVLDQPRMKQVFKALNVADFVKEVRHRKYTDPEDYEAPYEHIETKGSSEDDSLLNPLDTNEIIIIPSYEEDPRGISLAESYI